MTWKGYSNGKTAAYILIPSLDFLCHFYVTCMWKCFLSTSTAIFNVCPKKNLLSQTICFADILYTLHLYSVNAVKKWSVFIRCGIFVCGYHKITICTLLWTSRQPVQMLIFLKDKFLYKLRVLFSCYCLIASDISTPTLDDLYPVRGFRKTAQLKLCSFG